MKTIVRAKQFLVALAAQLLFAITALHAQESVPVAVLQAKVDSNAAFQLLDVRTAAEFKTGALKQALQADWLNKQQFADRIQYLDKNKPVIVYCASGVRSAEAAKWMLANGFTSVQNLQGGINAWKRAGNTVESKTPAAQVSIEDYNKSITSAPIVLVDFGAPWCPPCRQMEPVLAKLQKEMGKQSKLVQFNADVSTAVMNANQLGDALPVLIIYKNGKETWRKTGVATLDELRRQLQ